MVYRRKCLGLIAATVMAAASGTLAKAACFPMAGLESRIIPASYRVAAVPSNHVRLDFIGHASFEIESPAGVRVLTDYNGYLKPARLPHIVTMNSRARTHSTDAVEEEIKVVLRGWDEKGGLAHHNFRLKDVRIRNVATNVQEWGNGRSNESSMFVFEISDLCIAHLGHLRHVLTPEFLAELGRIDVVLAPIDGMWTMSHEELFDVLQKIKPPLIIPMHYGSEDGVEAFAARARELWPVRRHSESWIQVSYRDLPRKTEVLFLQGGY
jgi:L-ascorbate metabolism protein UlaG (beta-lactamase superfamily)